MLVGVGLVLLVGALTSSRSDVRRVSSLPAPAKPLSKPEPDSLLRADLKLTVEQRVRISEVDSAWQKQKSGLLRAMGEFQPKRGRTDEISASLVGYSQLSRDYDAIRSQYWSKARSVLTPSQMKEVGP